MTRYGPDMAAAFWVNSSATAVPSRARCAAADPQPCHRRRVGVLGEAAVGVRIRCHPSPVGRVRLGRWIRYG